MKLFLSILSWSLISVCAENATASGQGRPLSFVSTGEPGPTSPSNPSNPIEVWGHERLTWDQEAAGSESLSDLTFIAFVDGLVDYLENVRCSTVRNSHGFECSARLPRMVPGPHAIELIATDGSQRVSHRSTPLIVVLRSIAGMTAGTARVGVGLDAERVAGALVDVADIVALQNGIVLIGEESGRILAVGPNKPSAIAFDLRTLDRPTVEIRLLALAIAPDFDTSALVFAAYTTPRGLRLVRFTELNGVLTNHAILREGLPTDFSRPAAALAVGPDNKIYLATVDQVLRLNMDGSTPADGADSGLFSAGVRLPQKLSWNVDERVLWLLGSTSQGGSQISAIALGEDGRATTLASYDLGGVGASSFTVIRDSLHESRLIMTSLTSSELLEWRVSAGVLDRGLWLTANGPEDAVAVDARPGELWIASRSSLYRLDVSRR